MFLSYVLSFIYVGIYWNNHILLYAVNQVNRRILWANLHLLFWLSLIPLFTGWVGENHGESVPVALYGVVLLMCALAYSLLSRTLIAHHGKDSPLALALGKDRKGLVSIILYALTIPLSMLHAWLGFVIYVAVAALWCIGASKPGCRIEPVVRCG